MYLTSLSDGYVPDMFLTNRPGTRSPLLGSPFVNFWLQLGRGTKGNSYPKWPKKWSVYVRLVSYPCVHFHYEMA
jgi:hypothetical protein